MATISRTVNIIGGEPGLRPVLEASDGITPVAGAAEEHQRE